MLFPLLLLAAAADPLPSPWLLGGGTVGLIGLLAFLIVRIVKVGNDQLLLANRQAEVLLKPLSDEVERLTEAVKACEEESRSERMWHRILVGRLEAIIRLNEIAVPEETWVRPR